MSLAIAAGSARSLLEMLRYMEIPSQDQFIAQLVQLGTLEAVIMLVIGLVCLLSGWKAFKAIMVVNAAVFGVIGGAWVGELLQGANGNHENAPLFCAIAGGLLLASLAMPAMKYAVSASGGLIGCFLGYLAWTYIAEGTGREEFSRHAWAGALIGLIGLGLLSFVVFRLVIVITTCFQGAMMSVSGILSLLLKNQTIHDNLRKSLEQSLPLLPLLIGVPAMIGFFIQHASIFSKAKKKKKAEKGE